MNESKRRPKPCPDCGQAVGHYDDCPVGITGPRVNGDKGHTPDAVIGLPAREMLDIESDIDTFDRPPYVAKRVSEAQALALRLWHGQDTSELRAWRIARVKQALEGQGLSMESVVLP